MSHLGLINALTILIMLGTRAFPLGPKLQIGQQVAVIVLAVWAWRRLGRLKTTVAVQGACVALAVAAAPFNSNSVSAAALSSLLILALAIPVCLRPSMPAARRFRASLKVGLSCGFLLLYGWAVVHKLNVDFLNPQATCAVDVISRLIERELGLRVSFSPLMAWSAIALTLLLEGLLPVLVVLERHNRALWLLLLWGFHVVLSPSYFGFLPAVMILSAPFIQPRSCRRFTRRLTSARPAWLLAGISLVAAVKYPEWIGPRAGLFRLLLAALVVSMVAWPRLETASLNWSMGNLRVWWLTLFFLNGAAPYLGVKTVGSWAMYSNLRTEGRNNHLFLPAFAWGQNEILVLLPDQARPWVFMNQPYHLSGTGEFLLPQFELGRQLLESSPGVSRALRASALLRNSEAQVQAAIDAYQAAPWWQKKLFGYRPLAPDRPACMW